jgi:hypothetical protein
MRAHFPIPTSSTTMIIAKMPQDHDAGAGSPSRSWTYFSQAYSLLLTGFTLGIPSFHQSLASKESPLGKCIASFLRHLLNLCSGLPDTISVWKATRSFASLLFGCVRYPIILRHTPSDTLARALIATLFSPSIQTNIIIWFLISISLLQAILGLTCSNILIIYFSNRNRVCICGTHASRVPTTDNACQHSHHDPVQLKFFFWSVWDLFSVPCVLTAWYSGAVVPEYCSIIDSNLARSAVISTVALIVEIVSPGISVQCGPSPAASPSQAVLSNIARIVLSLSISISGVLFTFFLLHLRHLSCIFSQTTRSSDP